MSKIETVINEKLCIITFPETITDQDIEDHVAEIKVLVKSFNHNEFSVLNDISNLEQLLTIEQRKKLEHLLKEYVVRKQAFVVKHPFQRVALRTTFVMTFRFDIKVFGDRESALKWLRE